MISAKENLSAEDSGLPGLSHDLVKAKLAYANATLPFLSAVVKEIEQLAREHRSIRTRLGEIDLHRHLDGNEDLYSDELKAVEQSADELCDRLAECYNELDQVEGISFDAAEPTFVDFPIQTGNGSIHLCWRLGESTVSHWHWANETCDLRQPLVGFEKDSETEKSQNSQKSLLA